MKKIVVILIFLGLALLEKVGLKNLKHIPFQLIVEIVENCLETAIHIKLMTAILLQVRLGIRTSY
jgi:hypothetical protein